MNTKTAAGEPRQALTLERARITVLGYGRAAREHALGLRKNDNEVTIGLRLGGMSWVRARRDGFEAQAPAVLVGRADVVVVLVPDDEQASVYHHAIEPLLPPGSLLVFGRGLALETRVIEPRAYDVVLVTGEVGGSSFTASGDRARCRVAVHHDATGHALERAIAYARTVFGVDAPIGTTTVSAEVEAELAALEEHAGGREALIATVDKLVARVRDNHAPEETKVAFYEGLRDLLARIPPESTRMRTSERKSDTFLSWPGPGGSA